MNKAKELIAELKPLMGLTDAESEARKDEIAEWFRDHKTPENVEIFKKFLDDGLAEVAAEIEIIRQKVKEQE